MRTFAFLCLLFITPFAKAQTASGHRIGTTGYAGTYQFGKNIEKGPIGSILVYPETDSTILFYLDVNRGAPSYNMGQLYGRVNLHQGVGIFQIKFSYCDDSCKLNFVFKKKNLEISIVDNQDDCGFGFAVYANGLYTQTSSAIPQYFEEERKIYFKDTKPEDWNKE